MKHSTENVFNTSLTLNLQIGCADCVFTEDKTR